jgi:nicotinamide-nucleotide amidase
MEKTFSPETTRGHARGEAVEDPAARAAEIVDLLCRRGLSVVTAESCTSGTIATLLSDAPGAGECLHGSFVTYTKANKVAALGVPAELLARRSAVCPEVAQALAEGALARSPADIAVSVTGVAGPKPDEDGNPVGLLYLACVRRGRPAKVVSRMLGDIGRDACRRQAALIAFDLIEAEVERGS